MDATDSRGFLARDHLECQPIVVGAGLPGLILARCGWTALLTMRCEFARWGDRMNVGQWHARRFDVCRDQRNWRPCVGILLCSVARHCDPEPDNCDPAILDRHVLTLDKA